MAKTPIANETLEHNVIEKAKKEALEKEAFEAQHQKFAEDIATTYENKIDKTIEQLQKAGKKPPYNVLIDSESFLGGKKTHLCKILIETYTRAGWVANTISKINFNDSMHSDQYDLFLTLNTKESVAIRETQNVNENKTSCFIATACYGTYDAPEVLILRKFRDHILLNNPLGMALVKCYYTLSPPVADFITKRNILKFIVRRLVVAPAVTVARRLFNL